jgi:hypothetical protein
MPQSGEMSFGWINPDILRPYDPRKDPLLPPTGNITDEPTYCLKVNVFWWSHIESVLNRLMENDAWEGTLEEKEAAVQQIQALLKQTADINNNCGEGDMFELRKNPSDPCILQQSLDGGTTWTDVIDIGACIQAAGNSPPVFRVDPINPFILQQSTDGGETWALDNLDPRTQALRLDPINADNCARAEAMANGVIGLTQTIGQLSQWSADLLTISLAILAVLTTLLLAPTFAYKLIPAIVEWAKEMLISGAGWTEYFAALDTFPEQLGLVQAIYCALEPDGTLTDRGFEKLLSIYLPEWSQDPIFTKVYDGILNMIGKNVLQSMQTLPAGYNLASADCQSCACEDDMLFLFNPHTELLLGSAGTWELDKGYRATELAGDPALYTAYVRVPVSNADCNNTTIFVQLSWHRESIFDHASVNFRYQDIGGGNETSTTYYNNVNGGSPDNPFVFEWDNTDKELLEISFGVDTQTGGSNWIARVRYNTTNNFYPPDYWPD